jgi:hypothetical protein
MNFTMAGNKETKTKFTADDAKKMSGQPTKVYLKSVMQKIFREKWATHLDKLLSGDRATLDLCAQHLSKHLDFFPLLHTLCLVTGQKHDLNEKDHAKAADAWLVWYADNKSRLEWNADDEVWKAAKG